MTMGLKVLNKYKYRVGDIKIQLGTVLLLSYDLDISISKQIFTYSNDSFNETKQKLMTANISFKNALNSLSNITLLEIKQY
jgi:hypothetical protein